MPKPLDTQKDSQTAQLILPSYRVAEKVGIDAARLNTLIRRGVVNADFVHGRSNWFHPSSLSRVAAQIQENRRKYFRHLSK